MALLVPFEANILARWLLKPRYPLVPICRTCWAASFAGLRRKQSVPVLLIIVTYVCVYVLILLLFLLPFQLRRITSLLPSVATAHNMLRFMVPIAYCLLPTRLICFPEFRIFSIFSHSAQCKRHQTPDTAVKRSSRQSRVPTIAIIGAATAMAVGYGWHVRHGYETSIKGSRKPPSCRVFTLFDYFCFLYCIIRSHNTR